MTLKIVQISDVHVRNLKYHDEYRRVFENLYKHIDEIKPDIVINTGDTAHTKTQISPEFVEMASDHIRRVAAMVPYHLILGNHDMNLMNPDRQDAITPIVESIKSPNVHLHKKSGLSFSLDKDGQKYNFWVFSLADRENYPLPSDWRPLDKDVNIGLFHGSVATCVTDLNWRMTSVEHDLSIFDGLDFALLGDIHKQQFFRNRTIAYPGSLIQQNFGEELEKGFLLWNLGKKGEPHDVSPYFLKGSRKFFTVRLGEQNEIPDVPVEEGSRIRISPQTPLTLAQQKEIEKNVRKLYKPYDVITLSSANIGMQKTLAGKNSVDIENLRSLPVQEKLIRDFLADRNLDESMMTRVLDLNRKYQIHAEQHDGTDRNCKWKLNKLVWSSLFNFGENNALDMSLLPGLTGIFAPNGSGKSNLIDTILETCFDSTTKGVNKNIHLINDNKDVATMIADVTVNDQNYIIERSIERIKYGQRKFDETKEWGKTTVNFSKVDDDGVAEPLVGTLRPETENNIRQRIGTFDDFMLTSLSAQWNQLDIIANKETKRKEIFYKFFDLDLFEEKGLMAKGEAKEYARQLNELDSSGVEDAVKKSQTNVADCLKSLAGIQNDIAVVVERIEDLDAKIVELSSQKVPVENSKFDIGRWALEVKKVETQVTTNREKAGEIEGRLSDAEANLAKVAKVEERFDLKLHEEKVTRSVVVSMEISKLSGRLFEKKLALDIHKKNVALLFEVPCGDKFPSCKFLTNAFDSKSKLFTLEDEYAELKKTIDALTLELEELQPFKEKLKSYTTFIGEKENLLSRRDNLKLQVENLKLKIESLQAEHARLLMDKTNFEKVEKDIAANDEIEARVYELKKKKNEQSLLLDECRESISVFNRQIGGDQNLLERLLPQLDKLKELRETCISYEHYISAMGKDGIAYNILTQKLPLLNEEINKILSNAADFSVSIEHDVEEQSIRFYIQYGQYKRRLLELGSGAEKFLGSIAIRTALLNVSNLPKTNMFIIDEGFGKLDARNLESIQRMFDYLKTVFDHILVISHLESMKDMVDNIIEFTTDEEGYAHIDIGGSK